jgi:lipopolysaccharide transport system ATP-binding protein
MSGNLAVEAHGVGKRYALGERAGGYDLLTDRIAALARRERAPRREEFWALRDVDFSVERGETFGIVGHNGAGKSTLLKLLSRVTGPTTGQIDLNGRVGALLEVGTGFHPELTGGENIYLNGALLGMRRHEVARRFDEIVEFAEVQRFVETPVKRYSSGMFLRLAFAVAAHLEPEILIVDEVLSVGDLAFQEKCLGRMRTVAGQGRTVLFVSHNLAAVSNLCPRSMLLKQGRKVMEGDSESVIQEYVRSIRTGGGTRLDERIDRQGSGEMRFLEIHYERDGEPTDVARMGEDLEIVLRYETRDGRPLKRAGFAISVFDALGERQLNLNSELSGDRFDELPAEGEIRCVLPRCPLSEGLYFLSLYCHRSQQLLDWIERAAELTVAGGDYYGSGQAPPHDAPTVLVPFEWQVRAQAEA